MKMSNLNDLLVHELKDLYSAETQLVKALPKMAKAATDSTLRQAFQHHLDETREHVSRIERVCEELGVSPRGVKCKGMAGLIAEGDEIIQSDGVDDSVRDAALIAAAQRVEHYEIAGYGCATTYCERLGYDNAKAELGRTLEEEKHADGTLTEVALSHANPQAAAAGRY